MSALAAFDQNVTLLTLADEPDVIYVEGINRGSWLMIRPGMRTGRTDMICCWARHCQRTPR